MFVTNWISTTKIQKISEITNFFRHYFLSRTEVIKYADRWNWAYIIDRYGDDSITYNEEFLERYGEYIPASELGGSKLWDCIIEKRIKALKQEILA